MRASQKIKITKFWLAIIFLLLVVWACSSTQILERNIVGLWEVIYLASLIFIYRQTSRGFYSPSVVLLSSYVLILGIGSVLFAYVRGNDYWGYSKNLIGLGYVALWIGVALPSIKAGMRRPTSLVKSLDRLKSPKIFQFVILLSVVATLLLFATGGIPLISNDVNEAKVALLSGKGYLGVFFRGLPVISLATYYDAHARSSIQRKRIAHFLATVTAIVLLLSGYRAMTLIFVASYLALFSFLAGWRVRRTTILLGALGATLFLALVGAYRRAQLDLEGLLRELAIITTARPAITDDILRHYDEATFFYGERYVSDLVKMLPGSQTGANVDLKYELFSQAANMPDLAGITPGICAEAYMNFGALWVPICLFIVGGLSNVLYNTVRRSPSLGFSLLYFTLIFNLAGAMQSGLGTKLVHLIYIWAWIALIKILFKWRVSWHSKACPAS